MRDDDRDCGIENGASERTLPQALLPGLRLQGNRTRQPRRAKSRSNKNSGVLRERPERGWPVVAAILTLARFCEPSSELLIAETWFRRTALEDLLGVTVEQVHHRRLYDGLDQLLPHKEAIEQHLKERLGDLFDLKYELLLYDVTGSYFEGEAAGNLLAQWLRASGLGDPPRTLLMEMAKIKSGDVVLPARWADGTERIVHLRCVTTPDEAQKVLLNRLGLTLPLRLRRIDEVAQM